MGAIALGSLLELILAELDQAMMQAVNPAELFQQQAGALVEPQAEILNLRISDLDLDLPAHLQVQADHTWPNAVNRLLVTLPSTLEQPTGRLGRLRLTIAAERLDR